MNARAHVSSPSASASSSTGAGVVFAGTVGNAFGVTPTVTAVFGVFLVSMATEFSWPRAEVSGALAAGSLANMLASPMAGRIGDRWGARRTALAGSLILGLLILSLAIAPVNTAVLYLEFISIGAAGALPSGMIYAKLIAEWFESRRGFWIGIADGVGNGVGATLFPVIAGALLPMIGWRATFGVIALLILLLGLPIQWWLLREPLLTRAKPDGAAGSVSFEGADQQTAARTPTFWLLVTGLPVGGGCLIGLFSMIVPVVTGSGFSLNEAMTVIAVFALVCAVWEPSVGYVLDRSSRPRVLTLFYWISAAGVWLLLNAAYDSGIGYPAAVLCLIPVLLWNGPALIFPDRYPFNAATDSDAIHPARALKGL